MALTDTRIKALKPGQKPYKAFDARGLYLIVTPQGGRWWRFKFRQAGHEKTLSLGTYPDIGLQKARARRDELRHQVAEGIDPGLERKAKRAADTNTFEGAARSWLKSLKLTVAPKTYERKLRWLEDTLFPAIGSRPIAVITSRELLTPLKKVEAREHVETAHRMRSTASSVFRWAIAHGLCESDPTAGLRGALAPVNVTSRAALLHPDQVGELLRRIDAYVGQPTTHAALRIAPYVFLRPGELRAAEWSELTLSGEHPEWRIPAARMKMREPHIVPLARQVVAIFRELEPLTGDGRLVFPSLRGAHRPLSENTLNLCLRTMGYAGSEMTAHGFRATASTLLNERGVAPDIIEKQLAHKEPNEVRAVYNRAQRLDDRHQMMQAWADYLDELRARRPSTE